MSIVSLPPQRPPHPSVIMRKALAPFSLVDRFDLEAARDCRHLLTRDPDTGELAVLNGQLDGPSRRLAVKTLDAIPPAAQLQLAFEEITRAIDTVPSIPDYRLLIVVMLQAVQIKAGADTEGYAGWLEHELEHLEPSDVERSSGLETPEHVPLAALAQAVQWFGHNWKGDYGRAPAIPDVLEHCARGRWDLCIIRSRLQFLECARQGLKEIIDASAPTMPWAPVDGSDDDDSIPF